jgi:hypothetical protein
MSLATKSVDYIKKHGLEYGMVAGMAAMDYNSQVKEGNGKAAAAISSFGQNILPMMLFKSAPMQMAFTMLPAVPSLLTAIQVNRANHESYVRNSSLPFSYNGFQPTVGAMQAMQRGMQAMGQAKGLSQTHSALASQALRR